MESARTLYGLKQRETRSGVDPLCEFLPIQAILEGGDVTAEEAATSREAETDRRSGDQDAFNDLTSLKAELALGDASDCPTPQRRQIPYSVIENGVGLLFRDSIIADLRRIGVYFGEHRIHLVLFHNLKLSFAGRLQGFTRNASSPPCP